MTNYWHASHSLALSTTTDLSHVQFSQAHTPYKSECSCRLQWQPQLQFLHLFIFITVLINEVSFYLVQKEFLLILYDIVQFSVSLTLMESEPSFH